MKELTFLSRLFLNFLDKDRKLDYVAIAVLGGWPIWLAWYLDLHRSYEVDGVTYIGYLDKHNFWPLFFVLPAALWTIRWAFGLIATMNTISMPSVPPGIIQLLKTQEAKEAVYQAMRTWMSAPRFMGSVLIVSVSIQVADLTELASMYITEQAIRPGEFDWSLMYRIGIVSKGTNLIMVVSAYLVQFAITTIGVFGVVFLLAHNLFFLSRVYQRSRTPAGEEDNYIAIDLDDVNKCFGFRAANDSFNTQVIALIVGGSVVLISRFSSVNTAEQGIKMADIMQWPMNLPQISFFPDIGQWLLAIFWLVALGIVSLPAIVKLLPRLPIGDKRTDLTITSYLR